MVMASGVSGDCGQSGITKSTSLNAVDGKQQTDSSGDLAPKRSSLRNVFANLFSRVVSKKSSSAGGGDERILLAIDFDGTICERNTYAFLLHQVMIKEGKVPDELESERERLSRPHVHLSVQPFYTICMKYLAEQRDIGMQQVLDMLCERLPPAPGMLALLRAAVDAPHIDVVIVSDSNVLFISTLLHHWGIDHSRIVIFANRAEVLTADGNALPYIQLVDYSGEKKYNCPLCRENLCKGAVVKRFKQSQYKEDKIYSRVGVSAYILMQYFQTVICGDGGGDLCMALHGNTGPKDYIFGRRLRSGHCMGLQHQLCKIDAASELDGGPSSNHSLKPPITTHQLIYTDGRQLFGALQLPDDNDASSGDATGQQTLVSVYDVKMEMIAEEKMRRYNSKTMMTVAGGGASSNKSSSRTMESVVGSSS